MRFHDLRHVAQVFAAEAGATLPELMARLGHASPAAATMYLHARAERDHALTDALSVAMARGLVPGSGRLADASHHSRTCESVALRLTKR